MGIQDDIFDVRADIEGKSVTKQTLESFDSIITYLGNVEAGRDRAEESLSRIVAGEVEKALLVEERKAAARARRK